MNPRTGIGDWRTRIRCGFADLYQSDVTTGMIWPFAYAFDGVTLRLIRANRIPLLVFLRHESQR